MEPNNETNYKNNPKPEDTVKPDSGMFTGNNDKTENSDSQTGSENNSDKSSSNNLDSMIQMIQMINLMKGTQQTNNLPEETKTDSTADADDAVQDFYGVQAVETLSTPFDESLQTPALKALKAAIPYLEPQQQKNIGLFVKLFEIQQLINLHNSESSYATQNQASYPNSKTAILHAMRPYVTKEKQPMIDILVKIIDIKEIYEKIK